MVNGIRIIYPHVLHIGFNLKCVDFEVQCELPEEGRRMHRPKCCDYNDEGEDYSPNTMIFIKLHLRNLNNIYLCIRIVKYI